MNDLINVRSSTPVRIVPVKPVHNRPHGFPVLSWDQSVPVYPRPSMIDMLLFGNSPPGYVYASFPGDLFDELAASVISGFALFLSGVAIAVTGTFQHERR